MAGLYPLSRMQQFDGNGRLLAGARLFLFDGGTSTPRIGFRDSSLTSPHPNPILADAAGRLPLIYLDDGFYRHRLTTRAGTLVFDDDGLPVLSSTAGGSGTSVDPDSVFKTRDVKIRFDDQPIAGYVRLNGRTIGSASSGATERANADTQSLYEELWAFDNIGVTGGKGANAAADFAANKPLVLPNVAGRGLFGMDDMGAGAQNVLTSAVVGSDPAKPGASGGAQTVTLAASNLPVSPPWLATAGAISVIGTTESNGSHTHVGTTDSGGIDHSHGLTTDKRFEGAAFGSDFSALSNNAGGANLGTSGGASAHQHTHTFTTASNGSHNHTFTGNGSGPTITMQANGGGGQATNKLPPLITFMIYVRL